MRWWCRLSHGGGGGRAVGGAEGGGAVEGRCARREGRRGDVHEEEIEEVARGEEGAHEEAGESLWGVSCHPPVLLPSFFILVAKNFS
jgi:hypothetical protein